jgi:hypothetical protein
MKLHEMHLINGLLDSQGMTNHISSEKLNGQRVHVLSGPGKMIIITKHPHHFGISMKFDTRPVKAELDLNLNIVSIDSGRWSLSDEDVLNKKNFEARFAAILPKGLGSA